jgi:NADP-dependent 3-hydroxy acid dehydrogenase YdfG
MLASSSGHIFNMSSIAGLKPYPSGGSYSISKYALQGFSENLRLEMQPHGIKVTTICPGAVYTSSWNGSGVAPERIMEANDVAEVVWNCYSLSPQANIDQVTMRPQKGDL